MSDRPIIPDLGKLAPADAQRDAVHIAIAPVIATMRLKPGQAIGFVNANDTVHVGCNADPVGIVSPYLKQDVLPGQRFWMLLFPNTITSLRHDWTHPAFAKKLVNAASSEWLEKFADSIGYTYEELMEGARVYNRDGSCISSGSSEYDVPDEFWDHFAIIEGKIPKSRGSFFSCAC